MVGETEGLGGRAERVNERERMQGKRRPTMQKMKEEEARLRRRTKTGVEEKGNRDLTRWRGKGKGEPKGEK